MRLKWIVVVFGAGFCFPAAGRGADAQRRILADWKARFATHAAAKYAMHGEKLDPRGAVTREASEDGYFPEDVSGPIPKQDYKYDTLRRDDEESAEDRRFKALQKISVGHKWNRGSFPSFYVTFSIAEGCSDEGVDKAVGNGPTKGVVRAECVWASDGVRQRYEVNRDLAQDRRAFSLKLQTLTQAEKNSEKPLFSDLRLLPWKYMSDGKTCLHINPILHQAVVLRTSDEGPPEMITPWNNAGLWQIPFLDPDALIDRFLVDPKQRNRLRYMGRKEQDGEEVTCFAVDLEEVSMVYCHSPRDGFLPKTVESVDPKTKETHRLGIITDVLRLSRNRVFPKRAVMILFPKDKTKPLYVRELVVQKLETDMVPGPARLSLVNDDPISIGGKDPNSGFQVPGNTELRIEELDKWYERAATRGGR